MTFESAPFDEALHLTVALAIGLLVGTERGWKSRELGEGRRVAGLRTFGLTGLLGGHEALETFLETFPDISRVSTRARAWSLSRPGNGRALNLDICHRASPGKRSPCGFSEWSLQVRRTAL